MGGDTAVSISAAHDASAQNKEALIELEDVTSTAQFERWWGDTMMTRLAHDFAVVGRIDDRRQHVSAADVVMYYGSLREDRRTLLSYTASLLGAWRVMRQASLLDLGPCGCVGRHDGSSWTSSSGTFLIHGAQTGPHELAFAILTAGEWPDEAQARNVLDTMIDPIARCASRLPGLGAAVDCNTGPSDAERLVALSPREAEIGRWLCEGRTNKEIAKGLGISPNTVRNQISRISQKLGARNRAQLAMLLSTAGVSTAPMAPPR